MHRFENRDQGKTAAAGRGLSARGRTAGSGTAGSDRAVGSLVPRAALALQRAIGNRAFSALLDEGQSGRDALGGGGDPFVQRSAVEAVLRSPGQAMDPGMRARLEEEVGVDLSAVRMHTDADALRSAALIGARAYTSGRHIVIARNDVDTDVMKHEAIHILQQSMGPVPGRDNGAGMLMSNPEDHCEREASAGEARDVRHDDSMVQNAPWLSVQRYAVYSSDHPGYPGKYKSGKGLLGSKLEVDNGPGFFLSQHLSAEGKFIDSAGTANIRDNSAPPLQISDGLDLAIEYGVEAKCFYATKDQVKAANQKLKELNGRVSFTTSSRRLLITTDSGKNIELRQVLPMMTRVGQQLEGLDVRVPQRCNEMAEFVTRQVDVQGRMNDVMTLAKIIDRAGGHGMADAISRLRENYAKQKAPTQSIKDGYTEVTNEIIEIFKVMGNKNPEEIEKAIRELGLNQYLDAPNIGDVMATSNTSMYHFGGVVAVSGPDFITMENYWRGTAGAGTGTMSSGDPLYYFKMYGQQRTWHEATAAMVRGQVVVSVKLTG